MQTAQVIFLAVSVLCFAGLGIGMYFSIKRYESKAKQKQKKKKGRNKYMSESRVPGTKR